MENVGKVLAKSSCGISQNTVRILPGLCLLSVGVIFVVTEWFTWPTEQKYADVYPLATLDSLVSRQWKWTGGNLGCRPANLSLERDKNRGLYSRIKRTGCPGGELFEIRDSIIRVNKDVLRGSNITHCEYRAIGLANDITLNYSNTVTRTGHFEVKVTTDFLNVKCYTVKSSNQSALQQRVGHSPNQTDSEHFEELQFGSGPGSVPGVPKGFSSPPKFNQLLAHVHPKPEVLARAKNSKPFPRSTQMNVLIFGLDGVSHMAWQRSLPETYRYLKDTLGSVALDSYNVVGESTRDALIPLLTGYQEYELPTTKRGVKSSHFVDVYPFIWNKFKESGYVTLFAEEASSFQQYNNGFKKPPTDHYLQPFSLAANLWSKRMQTRCLGGRKGHLPIFDYVRDVFRNYPKMPKFAFTFLGYLTHDHLNGGQYVDADLADWLKRLARDGYLNNTLVIMMADHGMRTDARIQGTEQGRLEARLPFMSLAFPKTFQVQYPHLMANLRRNKGRLTTAFDVHETLRTMLDIEVAKGSVTRRGISLLQEIPANRTCHAAGINFHFCACENRNIKKLTPSRKKIKEVDAFVVSVINKKLLAAGNLCVPLRSKSVMTATKVVSPNTDSIDKVNRTGTENINGSNTRQVVYYQMVLSTVPYGAVFETTVQENQRDGVLSINGEINRVDRYGPQSHCVYSTLPGLAKYCYCRIQKFKKSAPES